MDTDQLPNDAWGFSCYSVVIPWPEELARSLHSIECASKMTRSKIPAHMTVVGDIFSVSDLELLKSRVLATAASCNRFYVDFSGIERRWDGSHCALIYQYSEALRALQKMLEVELEGICSTAYDQPLNFEHTTIVAGVDESVVSVVNQMLDGVNLGTGFFASHLDLMGRVDTADDGQWSLLRRFPL